MPDKPPASSAARRPLSALFATQGRVALVGVAVAALIAAVTFGLWSTATSAAPRPTAAAPAATGAALTTIPTPTAIPTPTSVPVLPTVSFKSQSGNLRCSIGEFSGEPAAICQKVTVNYAAPWGSCVVDQYQSGMFVGVRASGAYWPCVKEWAEPANVLAFDTPITQSGITCAINFISGVKCVNENGNGFTMEYDAGITQF